MNQKNKYYILSAIGGAAATFILTLVIYGLCLSSYNLSTLNYGIHALSCIANGFYIATVLRWGKFKGVKKGIIVGGFISFLTDAYFIGVSVAMFGTVSVVEGLLQACLWALINVLVGALTASVQKNMWNEEEKTTDHIFHNPFFSKENGHFAITGVIGGILAIALTAIIYAVILAPFLLSDGETVNAASLLLNAQVIIFPLANIAHGFLISYIIRWGKFYKPWKGALAAMAVACMTDLYFGFRDVAVQPIGGIKEMTMASAIQDTSIWMVLNIFLGAILALILGRYQKKKSLNKTTI